MLKINKDMSVKFDKDVSQDDIVNLMIAFYNGQLSVNMATQIRLKDDEWKKELEKKFIDALTNRFEEEFKSLFIAMSKPFFNQLGLLKPQKPPYVNPIHAFKDR